MQLIILEFKNKAEEINEYFSFIETTTHLRLNETSNTIQVSKTVHNVLKANLFLLLYNLVESSFKNALENICININNDILKYKEIIPELKEMWIEKEYKNFENCTIPKNTKKSKFIMNKIESITNDIVKIEFYKDEKKLKNDDISGNLDAREINRISKKYGAKVENIPSIDTNPLQTVKSKRNNLAHGDETFSECGESYTMNELKEINKNSIKYMNFILEHIQKFINEKKYHVA
jgi:hypothetical protein